MSRISAIVLLTIFYLAITSNLELANILAGLLIGLGITMLLNISGTAITWKNLPIALFSLIRYLLILAYDLAVSGIQVARLVLSRTIPVRQGITGLPTNVESELGTALSAHAITLTPGELVIEMDEEGVLYTHCIDASRSGEYIREAQEMREQLLKKIFP